MRIAILTVSDAGARGERVDTSGDAIVAWATARGAEVVERTLVPDESARIVPVLLAWCDQDLADLVLTTGGTGLSPRDITPEATRVVIERDAPGIAERLRVTSMERFSARRVVTGTRGCPQPLAGREPPRFPRRRAGCTHRAGSYRRPRNPDRPRRPDGSLIATSARLPVSPSTRVCSNHPH
jgi:molybdenum cofactor synthesis domain-containing protein